MNKQLYEMMKDYILDPTLIGVRDCIDSFLSPSEQREYEQAARKELGLSNRILER